MWRSQANIEPNQAPTIPTPHNTPRPPTTQTPNTHAKAAHRRVGRRLGLRHVVGDLHVVAHLNGAPDDREARGEHVARRGAVVARARVAAEGLLERSTGGVEVAEVVVAEAHGLLDEVGLGAVELGLEALAARGGGLLGGVDERAVVCWVMLRVLGLKGGG